eukprot:comp20035_c0_seq2/m.39281 comp20035_c0_seq2/g.39281  ORF comp20035_c0_seq2/g.39281 comp20035_c0_seq2/m.39281 type:complete len:1126 (-) comp20035_c0_seq2:61-3438(-)
MPDVRVAVLDKSSRHQSGKQQGSATKNKKRGPVGLFDVVQIEVPPMSNVDVPIVVLSMQQKQFVARLHVREAIDCPKPCVNGHCDSTQGTCVCAKNSFGSDCSLTHSQWMKTRVPINAILLVPGLGGSQLVADAPSWDTEHQCWIDAPRSAQGLMRSFFDGDRANKSIRKCLLGKFNPVSGTLTPPPRDTLKSDTLVSSFSASTPKQRQQPQKFTSSSSSSSYSSASSASSSFSSSGAAAASDTDADASPRADSADMEPGDFTVSAPGDDYGLYAISQLIPGRAEATKEFLKAEDDSSSVQYFEPLIAALKDRGFTAGVDLFGFPYDWRQSTRSLLLVDQFRDTIRAIFSKTQRKLSLVSHGTGGLLVRSFLAIYAREAEEMISTWIAIACPFQGLTGSIMLRMLQGRDYLSPLVSPSTIKLLAAASPSSYELLPNPGFPWEPAAMMTYTLKGKEHTVNLVDAHKSMLPAALACNSDEVADDPAADSLGGLGFNSDMYTWAKETRYLWDFARVPPSMAFYNVYGTTALRSTPQSLTFLSEVLSMCDLAKKTPELQLDHVDGDGEVPAESARNDGLNAAERIVIPDVPGHYDMLGDERLIRTVLGLTRMECSFEGIWIAAVSKTSPVLLEFSLYQFGDHVYGHLADEYKFAGSTRHGQLEGIVFYDGHETSSFLSARIEPHCMTADFVYRNTTTLEQLAAISMTRRIGTQCEPGQVSKCKVRHGLGLRQCSFGYWSTQCSVSKCDSGYMMSVDHLLSQVECVRIPGSSSARSMSRSKRDHFIEHRCSGETPFLCVDGTCASKIETCLLRGRYQENNSGSKCPIERPILCEDLSCVRVIEHCEKNIQLSEDKEDAQSNRLPGFGCPEGKSVVCPNGSCAESRDKCVMHHNQIPRPMCPGQLVYCPTIDFCIKSYSSCPPFKDVPYRDTLRDGPVSNMYCPWDQPIRCYFRGPCKATAAECPKKNSLVDPHDNGDAEHQPVLKSAQLPDTQGDVDQDENHDVGNHNVADKTQSSLSTSSSSTHKSPASALSSSSPSLDMSNPANLPALRPAYAFFAHHRLLIILVSCAIVLIIIILCICCRPSPYHEYTQLAGDDFSLNMDGDDAGDTDRRLAWMMSNRSRRYEMQKY